MPLPEYPLTTSWLKSIYPAGLDAFAECRSSTRLPLIIARNYPTLVQLPGLTAAVREALTLPMEPDGWMPETTVVLQQLLLREGFFSDDASFFAATKARVKASFSHPSIRPLMAMMSPHLLVMGAGRRWAAYHHGSTLQVKSTSMSSLKGTLSYPAGLYPPLMIEDTRVALESAIELTGKSVERLTATVVAPGQCTIQGSWR